MVFARIFVWYHEWISFASFYQFYRSWYLNKQKVHARSKCMQNKNCYVYRVNQNKILIKCGELFIIVQYLLRFPICWYLLHLLIVPLRKRIRCRPIRRNQKDGNLIHHRWNCSINIRCIFWHQRGKFVNSHRKGRLWRGKSWCPMLDMA